MGGFSYADVLGAAKGWAAVLKFKPELWAQLTAFRERKDTFSLGVCNGCQLMALLGWVPTASSAPLLPQLEQPRFIHNDSGRFESRFSAVTIQPSPAVLLKGMGSTLGVWVAQERQGALQPQDPRHRPRQGPGAHPPPTTPTSRPRSIPNPTACLRHRRPVLRGRRHLAMMPHPERCFLTWQQPWMPEPWRDTLEAGLGISSSRTPRPSARREVALMARAADVWCVCGCMCGSCGRVTRGLCWGGVCAVRRAAGRVRRGN